MPDPDWCMAMEETCEDVEGIYCKIKLQIEIEKIKHKKIIRMVESLRYWQWFGGW